MKIKQKQNCLGKLLKWDRKLWELKFDFVKVLTTN